MNIKLPINIGVYGFSASHGHIPLYKSSNTLCLLFLFILILSI